MIYTEFYGHQVDMLLNTEEDIHAYGKLNWVDDEGEAQYLTDSGEIWYCWPVLEVKLRDEKRTS